MSMDTSTSMSTSKLLMAAAVFLGLSLPGGVGAQTNNMRMSCHKAAEVAKQLANRYNEAPVAFGMQSNGNLLQVYYSEDNDTWTVVSTTPNGMSCIVAAGKRWEQVPLVSADPLA